MKKIKKHIRNTFDRTPHKSKERVLAQLGVKVREEKKILSLPRRPAAVLICILLLFSMGTAITLAATGGAVLETLKALLIPREETVSPASREETLSAEESNSSPYFQGKVILSSSAWKDELGPLITGEFASLQEALRAVSPDGTLYCPGWDGDGEEVYGQGHLVILLNARLLVDPATLEESYYPCAQINYHTQRIETVQIHFGQSFVPADDYVEQYETEEGCFYLRRWTHPATGQRYIIANAVLGNNLYEITAYDLDAAKKMIDSLFSLKQE